MGNRLRRAVENSADLGRVLVALLVLALLAALDRADRAPHQPRASAGITSAGS